MEQLQKITAKDLAQKMGVSIKTAEKYMKDVKQEYEVKVVLLNHINTYFKVNAKK
ncbi:HTH domain-containing protein [Flavobacterium branchiarum]|uniref:HTH domain-containing protein n=1 Tax=Flavobacterium branchiarum TaxID=1114870 RepID=A0ABV5FS12_9FLAO|nr:HTH domain-containing protein [Flavobacterium branchiarum]MDN3673433.1 HTH domain-containing protein [Flavobacterium branchiarum]